MNSSWHSDYSTRPLSPVTVSRSVTIPLSDQASSLNNHSNRLSSNSMGRSGSVDSPGSSVNGSRGHRLMSAAQKRSKYMCRLIRFKHMDFQYAFWQMVNLFIAPQKVYRNFQYRKQTRDQWARDDPAFLVLMAICLFGTSIGFALVLRFHFVDSIKLILWIVLVDCVAVGMLIASLFWVLCNRLLRCPGEGGSDQAEVEWGYAFDVHLNAFFPLLIILHLLQLPFLYPVILNDWFVSRLLGNTFWLVAIIYYIYITFLGYKSLPFLRRTELFLYPMTVTLLIYILSLGLGWNFSQHLCNFYLYRVG